MKKKGRCYNCKHSGEQFKINKLTYLHCEHPKYTKEDYENGKLSLYDTLRVFSSTCKDHKYK